MVLFGAIYGLPLCSVKEYHEKFLWTKTGGHPMIMFWRTALIHHRLAAAIGHRVSSDARGSEAELIPSNLCNVPGRSGRWNGETWVVASKHHPLDIKCDVVVDVSLNLNKSIHKGNQIQHTLDKSHTHTHTRKNLSYIIWSAFFSPWKTVVFSTFCFRTLFWMDPQPHVCSNRCIETREDQLSSQDLIDLIGAAGHLGGKLHMMTRALADQLEPRSSDGRMEDWQRMHVEISTFACRLLILWSWKMKSLFQLVFYVVSVKQRQYWHHIFSWIFQLCCGSWHTPPPPTKIQGTAMLSNTSLVQICLHLGALQMFPHRLAATLDLILPARLQEQQCQPQVAWGRTGGKFHQARMAVPTSPKIERSHHQSRVISVNSGYWKLSASFQKNQ